MEPLAAEEGFEPSQTESESVVLPLHNSAMFLFETARFIIPKHTDLSIPFLEKSSRQAKFERFARSALYSVDF
jgi:hypothetical protein